MSNEDHRLIDSAERYSKAKEDMRWGYRNVNITKNKMRDKYFGWIFFIALILLFTKINMVLLVPFILIVMLGWWIKFVFGDRFKKFKYKRRINK